MDKSLIDLNSDNCLKIPSPLIPLPKIAHSPSRLSILPNNPFDTALREVILQNDPFECASQTSSVKNVKFIQDKENIARLISPIKTPSKSKIFKKITKSPLYITDNDRLELSPKKVLLFSPRCDSQNDSNCSLQLLNESFLNISEDFNNAALSIPLPDSFEENTNDRDDQTDKFHLNKQSENYFGHVSSGNNTKSKVPASSTKLRSEISENGAQIFNSNFSDNFTSATGGGILSTRGSDLLQGEKSSKEDEKQRNLKFMKVQNASHDSASNIFADLTSKDLIQDESVLKITLNTLELEDTCEQMCKKQQNLNCGSFNGSANEQETVVFEAKCLSKIFNYLATSISNDNDLSLNVSLPPWATEDIFFAEDDEEELAANMEEKELDEPSVITEVLPIATINQDDLPRKLKSDSKLEAEKSKVNTKRTSVISLSKKSDQKLKSATAKAVAPPVKLEKNIKLKGESEKVQKKGPMKAVMPVQNMAKEKRTSKIAAQHATPSRLSERGSIVNLAKINTPDEYKFKTPIAQSTPNIIEKQKVEPRRITPVVKRQFGQVSNKQTTPHTISNLSSEKSSSTNSVSSTISTSTKSQTTGAYLTRSNSSLNKEPVNSSIPNLSRRNSSVELRSNRVLSNSCDNNKKSMIPPQLRRSSSFQNRISEPLSNANKKVVDVNKKYGAPGRKLKQLNLVSRAK